MGPPISSEILVTVDQTYQKTVTFKVITMIVVVVVVVVMVVMAVTTTLTLIIIAIFLSCKEGARTEI
jgi:hypothetical protein